MSGMIVTNFILIQTPTLLSLMLLLLTLFPREHKHLVAVVLTARSCMSESEDGCKQTILARAAPSSLPHKRRCPRMFWGSAVDLLDVCRMTL